MITYFYFLVHILPVESYGHSSDDIAPPATMVASRLSTSKKTDADAKQAAGRRMRELDNKRVVMMSYVARKEKSLTADDV